LDQQRESTKNISLKSHVGIIQMEVTTREEGTEVAKVEDVIPQPKEKKW
jgi:sporulation protein YlmC with PRC-barrel domain